MNIRTTPKLLTLATLLGLATAAQASAPERSAQPSQAPLAVLAQASAPAPAASAPAADAQPENRETPARPAARRRGVGVVISMSVA